MDCSSITDFQQSTAIRIAKKFRNLHIGILNMPNTWIKSENFLYLKLKFIFAYLRITYM